MKHSRAILIAIVVFATAVLAGSNYNPGGSGFEASSFAGSNFFDGSNFDASSFAGSSFFDGSRFDGSNFDASAFDVSGFGDSSAFLSSDVSSYSTSNPRPRGFLDTATTTQAAGWACDPSDFSQYVRVRVFVDNIQVATAIANKPRENAVGDQCGGNSNRGWTVYFSQNVANFLNNGNRHKVSAYAVDIPTGRLVQLSNSPQTVQSSNVYPNPNNALPKGFLDTATVQGVTGWTCDATNFQQALYVKVFVDGILVDTALANMQRESAVGDQCGGNTYHGYNVRFSARVRDFLSNGATHRVSVKAVDIPTGQLQELTNSPMAVRSGSVYST